MKDRVRNSLITHLELGWDIIPIFQHFTNKYDVKDIDKIYINTVNELRVSGRKNININKIELKYMENLCNLKEKVKNAQKVFRDNQK